MKSLLLATSLIIGLGGLASAQTVTLKIETQTNTGTMRAAVFDSQASFDTEKVVAFESIPAQQGTTVITIKNLSSGTYGIAVFQDENNDERLDQNLLGAPTEPFGFTNNPRIGFSAPKFEDFKFEHDGSDQEFSIKLNGL
ncbi:DUF2141 domain-containing protein [Planktotalea sp.]|uniref:DUF2141 domain-containing protein n=1 Tax=Planktotalea sp. TaxID=2029877 RepID=UPI003D6A2115